MAVRSLVNTTGSVVADRIVQGIVTLFEHIFPNYLCACFVEGSYANQSAVATSDLDLTLVLSTPFTSTQEQELAADLLSTCQHLSTLELDITLTDMPRLQQSADPMFKLGAHLLYGQDVRGSIPLMPITLWTQQRMHAAFWLLVHVFQRPQPITLPLSFPRPDDQFYGYAARPMQLHDGTTISTTRNLIRVTGWIATARIAYQTQQYVVRKQDCVAMYRESIGDEWTDLLQTIDQRCRQEWQYRIPTHKQHQAELRALAEKVLGFENHFLGVYRQFLLSELTSTEAVAQTTALAMLERTWFPDPVILDAIYPLALNAEGDVHLIARRLINQHNGNLPPTTQ